jgi:hypothetical protein
MATHGELRRLLDLLAGFPTTEAADRQYLLVTAAVTLLTEHKHLSYTALHMPTAALRT